MPITVTMIEEKEFKTKVRGYDPVEVDEFLDDICDEMVAMQEEIASLQTRLSQQSARPVFSAPVTPPPAPISPIASVPVAAKPSDSDAAQKLLEKAQKVYDDTIADAKREAQALLSKAQVLSGGDLEALETEKKRVQEEIDMLRAAAKDYKARFQRLVEDQQHVLSAETELFE